MFQTPQNGSYNGKFVSMPIGWRLHPALPRVRLLVRIMRIRAWALEFYRVCRYRRLGSEVSWHIDGMFQGREVLDALDSPIGTS